MKEWLGLSKEKLRALGIGAALVLVALAGVWLVLAPQGASSEPSVPAWEKLSPYRLQLEEQLVQLLEQVGGVEQVQVQITLESEGESLVDPVSAGLSATQKVVGYSLPRVRGVAVVCSPTPDDACRLQMTRLICSLYDVGASQVCVI